MIFAIARETGWQEDYIAWLLPFVRFIAYEHCIYESLNIACYEVGNESARSAYERMRKEWQLKVQSDEWEEMIDEPSI